MADAINKGLKGKSKKYGRNKVSCGRYKLENRRFKHKLYNVLKHQKKHGTCKDIEAQITRLKSVLTVVEYRPIFARFGVSA